MPLGNNAACRTHFGGLAIVGLKMAAGGDALSVSGFWVVAVLSQEGTLSHQADGTGPSLITELIDQAGCG